MKSLLSKIDRVLVFVGGIFLVAMIVLTTANIIARPIWVPIPGTFELMGFFGAIVAALALGYTQRQKGHIAVDILIGFFPKKVQRVLEGINSAACLVFFGVLAWQIIDQALVLRETGELTETLRIVYYPFTLVVALGCAFLSLVFLNDLIRALRPEKERPH